MTFWFYFTCIKISPRQTITSRSLASTLNLTCANDVTCSYDVIMRKRQVLNLTLTLRVPRFSLRPKQCALCQINAFQYLATRFWYALIGNPEDRFCRIDAHICIYIHVNAGPIHKPVSCDMHIEMSSPSRLLVANSAHDQRLRDPYQK